MDMNTDTGSEMMKKMLEVRLGQGTRREKCMWRRKVWWLYRKERLIGFGTVYSAVRRTDGLRVAIKEIIKNPAIAKEDNVPLEIILLQQVKDVPGVIQLVDYFECRDMVYIVMERVNGQAHSQRKWPGTSSSRLWTQSSTVMKEGCSMEISRMRISW